MFDDDLSSNCHSSSKQTVHKFAAPELHPELAFADATLAIVTGSKYFLVHRGLVCRHSAPLSALAAESEPFVLDGRSLVRIELSEDPEDILHFLRALYDGVSAMTYGPDGFVRVSSVLRMSAKYQVQHLRVELLRCLSALWPSTLAQWEVREAGATDPAGVYQPRQFLPHPILIINLARQIKAAELLPSAFYDLSRSSPSDAVSGYFCKVTSVHHQLPEDDLMNLLRGREHASRFLSTFIVNELEGREPSATCLYRRDLDARRRRTCQAAFESITFEILRDVNGVVCHRTSDPLFAILDAELMQSRDLTSPGFKTCESCRIEFSAVVDSTRDEFWHRIPSWFGLE